MKKSHVITLFVLAVLITAGLRFKAARGQGNNPAKMNGAQFEQTLKGLGIADRSFTYRMQDIIVTTDGVRHLASDRTYTVAPGRSAETATDYRTDGSVSEVRRTVRDGDRTILVSDETQTRSSFTNPRDWLTLQLNSQYDPNDKCGSRIIDGLHRPGATFVGEGSARGLKTYKWKAEKHDGRTEVVYTERAPDLNCEVVGVVSHETGGALALRELISYSLTVDESLFNDGSSYKDLKPSDWRLNLLENGPHSVKLSATDEAQLRANYKSSDHKWSVKQ